MHDDDGFIDTLDLWGSVTKPPSLVNISLRWDGKNMTCLINDEQAIVGKLEFDFTPNVEEHYTMM